MTTLFFDDFLSGFLNWTSTTGNPTIVDSPINAGKKACFINAPEQYATKLLSATYPAIAVECDVYLTTLPWADWYNIVVFKIGQNNPTVFPGYMIDVMNVGGGVCKFRLRDDNYANDAYSTTIIQLNTEYHVRMEMGGGGVTMKINGAQEASLPGGNAVNKIQIGGGNVVAAAEYIENVNVESVYVPPVVPLQVSVSPSQASLQINTAQVFSASVQGGTVPYGAIQWKDNITQQVLGTGTQYSFSSPVAGNYQIYASVTDSSIPAKTVQSAVALITVFAQTNPVTLAAGPYKVNCVWVDAGYSWGDQPDILVNNLPKFLNDCASNHITHVFIQVCWWNSADPAHLTTDGYGGGMRHSKAFYDNVVAQLHALGIKAIAWVGSMGDFGPHATQPSGKPIMDFTAGNIPNVIRDVVALMSGDLANWDGYNDDCESFVSDTVNTNGWFAQVNFYNALTPALHAIGKLNMPCVGIDWQSVINQRLYVDYIVQMFYNGGSTLEQSTAHLSWQEEFNIGGVPSASPIVLAISLGGASMAWQMNKMTELLDAYGAPQLVGFCWWMYELIGINDWTQWKYWIDHIGTSDPPVAKVITIQSSPFDVDATLNGVPTRTPFSQMAFLDVSATVTVPPSFLTWIHHPLATAPDDAGSTTFGGTNALGATGYDWAYCNGPYVLLQDAPVSGIYFYSYKKAKVKLAIYGSKNSDIGYLPGGWFQHPYNKIAETGEFLCTANTWNFVPLLNPVTLPASVGGSCKNPAYTDQASCELNGSVWRKNAYFIVMECQESMTMGGSGGGYWGSGQVEGPEGAHWIPFPDYYEDSFYGGQVNGVFACYIGSAPPAAVPYMFQTWDDGDTSLTRTIHTTETKTLTANYAEGTASQISLTSVAGAGGSVSPSGTNLYYVGYTYSFTAIPSVGYGFNHWDLNGTNMGTNLSLQLPIDQTMDGGNLTAIFAVVTPTTIMLNIVAGANGNVSPSGAQTLNIGQSHQFTATPNYGCTFDHWDLGGANLGSSNPIAIIATADMNEKTLTALFTVIPPVQISLNIIIYGNGVTNPTAGTQIFNVGDSIEFSAIPNMGFAFAQWQLNGSTYTDNPLILQITEDMNQKTLTVKFTGPAPITSAILPAGILLIGIAGIIYLATRKKR